MWRLYKMRTTVFRHSRSPIYKHEIRMMSVSRDMNNTMNLKPWTQIPGPKSYPFVGALLNFLPGGEFYNLSGFDMIQELFIKYGPIVRLDKVLDKTPMIFLHDADYVEQVFREENETSVRPTLDSLVYFRKSKKNFALGSSTGLISENGEPWRKFRSIVNPVVMQPKIIRLYTSNLNEVALEMVERMKSLRDENYMIPNLEREIYLWSLESLGVIALGCRLKCFNNNLDKDSPEQQLIEVVENIMKSFDELDIVKPSFWKYYPTKTFKKAKEYYERQETLAIHFIDQAIKEFESNPRPDDQKGVLEKLLDVNKEVALIMASDMLLAGIDTVTHSVLGALYLLASNTDKQSKLREELKTNNKKRPYLKACVKEAIRMMPVVAGTARITTKEYNILGYKIPKGICVIIANRHMSRMEKYFRKPNEFIPERWLVDIDDPLCYKNGHPFAYNPFGFGSRACIGRRIAELEMETFIDHAVRNFEIEWFGPPPNVLTSSVNYVQGPHNFIFKDVK